MPSELKSETARINGAKLKGPKTPEGRGRSSRNAIRHGLTARYTIVLENENLEEFHQMLADYRLAHQPATAVESDLVDQMVINRWRMRRLLTIETALLHAEITRRHAELKKQYTHFDGATELALAFRSLADESRSLALTTRHEFRLYRMHDLAHRASAPSSSPGK
jgi:hypothetical protein